MAYAVINFKTKKALKEAVSNYNYYIMLPVDERVHFSNENDGIVGEVRAYQPGLGPDLSDYTGSIALEGPHYPAAHTWYAACEMKNGVIIKVR